MSISYILYIIIETIELLLAQAAATEDEEKHIVTHLKKFILFCKNIY
jgi:hypothetical protein